MERKIAEIVTNSQTSCSNHLKNVKLMEIEYNKEGFTNFSHLFLKLVQAIMRGNFDNSNVKNIIDFLGKFVGHITTVQYETEQDAFVPYLLEFLINQLPKIQSLYLAQEFKQNLCLFWSSTLRNIGDDVTMDNSLGQNIQNNLLEALQDAKPLVRHQAVLALARLQTPPNRDCPVIHAFITCLCDSNPMVRRETVRWLAPNVKSISKLAEKVRDSDPGVRRAVFSRLADIGIKFFKIIQRQYILRSGFAETNAQVKKMFLERLLPSWLTNLNGSYLDVLKAIKLDADENDIANTEELSSKIMKVFFKTEPINDLIDALPLNDSKVIPENLVQNELIHYWNIVVKYLRQSEDLEEYLDKIIPDLTLFCNYILKFASNKLSKSMEEWENLNIQFILFHLFDIAENYDLSDEVGRKTLDELIRTLLSRHRLQSRLLNKLVEIGRKLAPSMEDFAFDVNVIISNIWQPMIDQPPDEYTQRQQNFKVSELKVKLFTLERDLEDAVKAEEFLKAQELTEKIQETKKLLDELLSNNLEVRQVRVTADDSDTLCWCLDILAAILVHSKVKTLPACLITCRQTFLMPLIQHSNPEVHWRVFKCLAIYCVFDRELAREYLKALGKPIAFYRYKPDLNKTMLTTSISIVTDLIRDSGLSLFSTEEDIACSQNTTKRRLYNEDTDELNSLADTNLSVDSILSVFLDMLDDDNDEIRHTAITALAKLILNGFPINSMVITRLILKWYNPATRRSDNDSTSKAHKRWHLTHEGSLQQKIGVIINTYVNRIESARGIITKAIVPIVNKICEAPRSSPLADIDMLNVIKFLSAITDSGAKNTVIHIHIEVARTLVHEMSSRPSEIATVYFAKMLKYLNINPDNSPGVKDLIANCELLLEKEILEKTTRQEVQKFMTRIRGNFTNLTVSSTNKTTTNCEANQTDTHNGQHPDVRRLSLVIEESNSSNATDENHCNNAENLPLNQIQRLDNVNGERVLIHNCLDEDQQAHARLSNSIPTKPAKSPSMSTFSSGSVSDVIPSSQTISQRRSRRRQTKVHSQIFTKELRVLIDRGNENTVKRIQNLSLEEVGRGSPVSESVCSSSDSSTRRRSQRIPKKPSKMLVNGASENIEAVSVQVKRKKIRSRKSSSNESMNGTVINAFDMSDQSLHTIIETSECHMSILSNDSPVKTRRSSRRLQVVTSESTSDESPPRTRENKVAKKKT